jgi:hypothetical protein
VCRLAAAFASHLSERHGCGRRQRESIKIKEEYYSFRDSSGVQFVLFSSLLLAAHTWTNQRLLKGEPSFVPPIKVGLQAFLCWLLYFYVALSMRENVLCANGSQVGSSLPTCAISILRRGRWWYSAAGLIESAADTQRFGYTARAPKGLGVSLSIGRSSLNPAQADLTAEPQHPPSRACGHFHPSHSNPRVDNIPMPIGEAVSEWLRAVL